MDILDVSPDILKDLIFEHLLIEATAKKYSSEFFSFKWNDKKSNIIYEDIDYVVDGHSCWEDSEDNQDSTNSADNEKYTSAHTFDSSEFGCFFNSFLIPDYIIHKQNEKNMLDTYLTYLDNYKSEYEYYHFIFEDTRQEDEDVYYNYNRVRTLSIDVDKIITHLKNLNVSKNLDEVSSVFHNLTKDYLKTFILFSQMENQFPEKNIKSKKMKI